MAIFHPATSGTSGSNYNPRNTQCIPVVIIFAFLDLGKNISSSDSLLVKVSQRSYKSEFCRLYYQVLEYFLRVATQE